MTLEPGGEASVVVTFQPGAQVTEGSALITLSAAQGEARLLVPVVSAPPGRSFEAEAEDATRLEAPFERIEERDGSNGACVGTIRPADFTPSPVAAGSDEHGAAIFEFELTEAGNYRLSARVWWIDRGGNSLWARLDDGEDLVLGNDENMLTWQWIAGPAWELQPGRHTLRIGEREVGARLDRVYLAPTE